MENRKNDNLNDKAKNKKHFNNSVSEKYNENVSVKKEDNLTTKKKEFDKTKEESKQKEEDTFEKEKFLNEITVLKEEKLRVLAEMENLRKRFEREKNELIKFSSINLVREILSPGDNLERALAAIPQDEILPQSIKNLVDGLKMVQKEFNTILEKNGVKKINSLNKKFDHNYHQAIMEIEKEDVAEGVVVQEIQTGYTMHDRLLRPAMVAVSKKLSAEKSKSKEKLDILNKVKNEENKEK